MTCTNVRDFSVQRGETFHPTIRWGTGVMTTKAITGVSRAAPTVVTAPGHALPAGWPAAVVGVEGMTAINDGHFPPTKFHGTTNVDANNVTLLDTDSSNYPAYSANGFLVYDTPQTLTGVTFNFSVYAAADLTGTPLVTLTSTGGQITVDNLAKTITPLLQTAGVSWTTAYCQLLATDGAGVVTELLRGVINIE